MQPSGKCDTPLRGCNAGACARCGGMLAVKIQSGLCGDQNVSTHPRPRCQGQTTLPAACIGLLRWAGRGHTRTVVPRLGSCSWSDPARSERDPQLSRACPVRGPSCGMHRARRRRMCPSGTLRMAHGACARRELRARPGSSERGACGLRPSKHCSRANQINSDESHLKYI